MKCAYCVYVSNHYLCSRFRHIVMVKNIFLFPFIFLILLVSCQSQENADFIIGVSQCSSDEWRTQINNEMQREALFYPNIKIDIKCANDNSRQQIKDIEDLINSGADILIISPNEAEEVMPAIEKVYDSGIPVLLVDRKINSDKYTAYIGADNFALGMKAGEYISSLLGGEGNVVELTGLKNSTPAVDRHNGLVKALGKYPKINLIASVDAKWFQDSAKEKFDSIVGLNKHIDLVFAHNDRMAMGAYEVAKEQGLENDILFVGVDALAGKGYGVESIVNGELNASFIYPTGGDKVIELAMKILQGKDIDKENLLSSDLVNKSNARIMQMQTEHIATLDQKIKVLDGRLDNYLQRYSIQRMFLFACLLILFLVCVLLFFVVKAFWIKVNLNKELSMQKNKLEEQRNQLVELSKKLEEATQAKLAFFTNVSHDFRTPLTLIADPVDKLIKSEGINGEQKLLLNIISKNVTILLRLTNQILDFRKYESGKLSLNLSDFDISSDIKEWAESFKELANKRNIRFNIDIEPSENGYNMLADSEKIERITYNLLSNAFKFTPENGEIGIRLSQFENNGCWLRLVVADNGIGISSEHINHIFDNFYQVNVNFSGSGIGLAMVKAFVDMHKGKIMVESEPGKGTEFIVELPMRQMNNEFVAVESDKKADCFKEGALFTAEQEDIAVKESEHLEDREKETILVIDDNHDVREYVRMLLCKKYNIIEAANGEEGVKLAQDFVPDAIICDVMMPVMDGMECCRQIKGNMKTSHIPVMMLTAYAGDEQRIMGYDCGADSYITKPFSSKLMMTRIENLMENRKRVKNFFSENANEQKNQLCEVDRIFVDRLEKTINEKMSDPDLNVEEIGTNLGLGRVQLYRKTKALTGYSPNELLRITRLSRAAELLKTTDMTIAEITYEVGFSSPSYFTKCYKDYFSENPTDTLKKYRGDK